MAKIYGQMLNRRAGEISWQTYMDQPNAADRTTKQAAKAFAPAATERIVVLNPSVAREIPCFQNFLIFSNNFLEGPGPGCYAGHVSSSRRRIYTADGRAIPMSVP